MSTAAAPVKGAEPVKAKAPAPAPAKAGAGGSTPAKGDKGAGSPAGRKTPKEAAGEAPKQGAAAKAKGEGAEAADGGLSAKEKARLAAVEKRAEANQDSATTHESAKEASDQARAAVAEPKAEATGTALDAHAGHLAENAPPDPEIVEKVLKLKQAIRDKRPVDEDELGQADPEAMAQAAGQEVAGGVKSEVEGVDKGYAPVAQKPEGTPSKEVTPLPDQAAAPPAPDVNAGDAAPDPVKPEQVSLDAEKKDLAADAKTAKLDHAGMEQVKEGPIPEAIAAKGELEDLSIWGPNEVLKSDKELRATATADFKVAEAEARKRMAASRKAKLAEAQKGKEGQKSEEETKREAFGAALQKIYDDAEIAVKAKLEPMVKTAMTMWDEGIKPLNTNFERALKRVDKWIKDRQDSIISSTVDFFAGLPGWIINEYETAETEFANGAGDLALTISSWVNGIIKDCQKIITDAKKAMKEKVDHAEPALKEFALEKQAGFEKSFNTLSTEVSQAKKSFTKQLGQKLTSTVNEKRQKVAALREKSKGLWQRCKDAVKAFIDDPLKALIDGLLSLLGIPPAAFWAMVAKFQSVIEDIKDRPEVFANNLVAAIKKGFEQFRDNIGTHLIKGLLTWLTSKLKDAGVEAPADLSLKSLLTLFLQILGISWPKIRTKLVKYIGEQNMKRIELAVKLVTTFINEGWEGLYKLLQQQLNPQILVDAVLSAVKKFIIETIVKQAALRIVALFNPVGAIVQALELIYKAVTWIIDNAAKIFSFIEAIVNGAANIMAGAIGGAANMIEKALGMLVPVVIDLFAKLVGLGGLPDKVKEVVGSLQAAVDAAIDKAIAWIASKIGLSTEEDKKGDTAVGEVMPFSGGGEGHKVYFEVSGDDATLMVASAPATVEERLKDFKARLDKDAITDKIRREKAAKLIEEASNMEAPIGKSADSLVRQARQQSVPDDKNAKLTDQQRLLVQKLSALYDLFGESAGSDDLPWRGPYSGAAGGGDLMFEMRKVAGTKRPMMMVTGTLVGLASGATRLSTAMNKLIAIAEAQGSAVASVGVAAVTSVANAAANAAAAGEETAQRKESTDDDKSKALTDAATLAGKVADYRLVGAGHILELATAAVTEESTSRPVPKAAFDAAIAIDDAVDLAEARVRGKQGKEEGKPETLPLKAAGGTGPVTSVVKQGTTVKDAKRTPPVVVPSIGTYVQIRAGLAEQGADLARLLVAMVNGLDHTMPVEKLTAKLTLQLRSEKEFPEAELEVFGTRLAVLITVEVARAAAAWSFALVELTSQFAVKDPNLADVFQVNVFPHAQAGFVEKYARRGAALFNEQAAALIKKVSAEVGVEFGDKSLILTKNDVDRAVLALKLKLLERYDLAIKELLKK